MNKRRFAAAVSLVAATALFTGCSLFNKTPAAPAAAPAIAYVDVDRAMQALPQWAQVNDLNQRINQLQAQLQQQGVPVTPTTPAGTAAPTAPPPAGADAAAAQAGISAAARQQYDAKMAEKQAQLRAQLTDKASSLQQQQKGALDAYAAQVRQQYQPQIFNLQLKLQTLKMTKEEHDAAQAQLDQLQKEQNDKIAAKQQELAAQFDQSMSAAQASAQQEMAAYGNQLQQELAASAAAQQAQMNARADSAPAAPAAPSTGLSATPPAAAPANGDAQQTLSTLVAQRNALVDFLRQQIRDKASQLAAQQGYAVVITKPLVNVSAVDITSQVLAEFRK